MRLTALERLNKSPYTYNGRIDVTTLVLSFLTFFLSGKKDNHKSLDELNLKKNQLKTVELTSLEYHKNLY